MKLLNKIPEETITDLREQILNKRVKIQLNDGSFLCGICEFFGYNKLLPSYGLQITINRTPVTNINLKNIEIL